MLTNEANFAAPSLLTRSHHSPRHQQIGRGADGRQWIDTRFCLSKFNYTHFNREQLFCPKSSIKAKKTFSLMMTGIQQHHSLVITSCSRPFLLSGHLWSQETRAQQFHLRYFDDAQYSEKVLTRKGRKSLQCFHNPRNQEKSHFHPKMGHQLWTCDVKIEGPQTLEETELGDTTTNLLGGPDIGCSFFVCCQKLKNNILN